jgi:hypothetical protein
VHSCNTQKQVHIISTERKQISGHSRLRREEEFTRSHHNGIFVAMKMCAVDGGDITCVYMFGKIHEMCLKMGAAVIWIWGVPHVLKAYPQHGVLRKWGLVGGLRSLEACPRRGMWGCGLLQFFGPGSEQASYATHTATGLT